MTRPDSRERCRPRRPCWRLTLFGLLDVMLIAAVLMSLRADLPSVSADPAPPEIVDAGVVSRMSARGENGRLTPSQLQAVAGVRLAPEAADAFGRMVAAARRDGATIVVTDGYRSLDLQVELKRRKGRLAATPGTSLHGWGIAVDLDMERTDAAWLRAHASEYGWVHPAWAQPGGSKPEPWHWEYRGTVVESTSHGPPTPSIQRSREPGELVARVRFEPLERPTGTWFDVREGIGGIESGASHYSGTAEPGARGNFAVAGFKREHGAPLRGVDRLRAGDLIRVRTTTDEHTYVVVDHRVLAAGDGWAVGPDPLDSGDARMMTLTTAAPDDGLAVVWARRR